MNNETYCGVPMETVREKLALLADMLEDGRIPADNFNMGSDCGSACCAGGHLALILDIPAGYIAQRKQECDLGRLVTDLEFWQDDIVWGGSDDHPPFHRLFFPVDPSLIKISDISPIHAAQAIRNFLATGEPDWYAVLYGATVKS
jgi:hypothetical protein